MPPIDVDMSAKTCIVTGANSGIGRQVAKNLARMGAHVVMACRSRERGERARTELAAELGAGDRLELMLVDLSLQASIRRFASEVLERHPRIDVLVNNAGIYPNGRVLTDEGIESTWATNVLAYELLTDLLLDRLRASAPSRIVNVASDKAGGLELDDLQWERRRFGGIKAYMQSKQANRMLAWVRASELEGSGVSINVVHPGGVNTGIGRNQKGLWGVLVRIAFKTQKSPADGADTATWLAASPDVEGISGKYYADRRERACEFRDMDQCAKLHERVRQMIGQPS